MKSPLSSKQTTLLLLTLTFLLLIVVGGLSFFMYQNKKNLSAELKSCVTDLVYQEGKVSVCEIKTEKYFEQHGECTPKSCLFASRDKAIGIFTFTGDTRTEIMESLGGEKFECTSVTVTDAATTPLYLLKENFGVGLTFNLQGEIPVALKNKKNVTMTATFPTVLAIGVVCPGHTMTLITAQ